MASSHDSSSVAAAASVSTAAAAAAVRSPITSSPSGVAGVSVEATANGTVSVASSNNSASNGTTPTVNKIVTVTRARRRPARYSPELSAAPQQLHQQQPQQQPEMTLAGFLADGVATEDTEDHQQQLLDNNLNGIDMPPKRGVKGKGVKRRSTRRRGVNEDGKRQRVANVLLENEMLIDEIRERKALWMRTHEQHHSSTLTAPLWQEIAKVLDTTAENIRKRWKNLKDHYRRELKKSMTDATAPPSVWPYYKKMRFMKSQMFVSLRRKNGEDHLEILSDDEEEMNNQWHGNVARKVEANGDETMDDYEMTQDYNEMIKYEQHVQTMTEGDEVLENGQEEEEEEDDQQQQQEEQGDQEEEELSPIASMHDEELSALQQQQAELSELSNMSNQADMTTTMGTINGIPTIVTSTANNLSGRISTIPSSGIDEALDAIQRRLSGMQQQPEMSEMENRNMSELNARHSAIQQQHANINGRLSAIQRNAEMHAIQQRANISAMHQRAEMSTMQQRSQMQQRNGQMPNGVDNSNVSIGDEEGGISDDYHFFMSLMPHVRNFNSIQKLKVRNRIQQIIIEEASNAQYDPLENC